MPPGPPLPGNGPNGLVPSDFLLTTPCKVTEIRLLVVLGARGSQLKKITWVVRDHHHKKYLLQC